MAPKREKTTPPRPRGNVSKYGDYIAGGLLFIALMSVMGCAVYALTRPTRRTFILQGQKIQCDASMTECGMHLSNCTDAPHVVLRCVTDLPEWVEE